MTQASPSQDPPPAGLPPAAQSDPSPWNWLLLGPIVLQTVAAGYFTDVTDQPQAEPVVIAGGLA